MLNHAAMLILVIITVVIIKSQRGWRLATRLT
ncbi:leader peptide IlvL [Shewanella vesiculosa]|nr:MAG: leader peptide IlvL [Shewanella sp. CG_4_10_14_3_um_filter_42_91]PIY68472.1 MAG: leader peptide IlvL [Shewanella sp. CG_4_10_14_0_8_um_filter_42_13]PJB93117.1 MAG: leader peptide IlvL [Shewanella sp. CG_4_9_14_0_8_um_filter_42_14]RPA46213.1 leader peptide IlvL [Shewanella vesiculosa]